MDNPSGISLVDNTVDSQPPACGDSSEQASGLARQSTLTKHISRASVLNQLVKRKYAKWQPERLGVTSDAESRDSSRARRSSISAGSSAGPASRQSSRQRNGTSSGAGASKNDIADFDPVRTLSTTNETVQSNNLTQAPTTADEPKILSELDILYENQRGWFFFGIPLYSHSSLLNFDPSAWMTHDKRPSAVNITNAQVPDPSWEWAWRTWYVDMSGDVDEQGWQYAFSFASSQWRGTHPWFHSFVRRRRWVRLRTKISERRHRGRSEFERGHMLNEDYFTIHSSKVRSREQSLAGLSRVETGVLSRVGSRVVEEGRTEEIGDIPSLLYALKQTSIDRERIDALKKFIDGGGEELYYLNDSVRTTRSFDFSDTLLIHVLLLRRFRRSCQCSSSKPPAGNLSPPSRKPSTTSPNNSLTQTPKTKINWSASGTALLAQSSLAKPTSLAQNSLPIPMADRERAYWI